MVSRLLLVGLLASMLLLTACLQTRAGAKEQEEKQVLSKQVNSLQKSTADVNSRFNEIDEDLRRNTGKVEQVDARLTQIKERAEKNDFALENRIKEQDIKINAFREEIVKLQSELAETRAIAQATQTALQSGAFSGGGGSSDNDKKDLFAAAEAKFDKKEWRDAVFAYEQYRKREPKGKHVVQATYKIGVCFQEMGVMEDAKLFYEEVISRAPKSKEADRARTRLKAIAKKK